MKNTQESANKGSEEGSELLDWYAPMGIEYMRQKGGIWVLDTSSTPPRLAIGQRGVHHYQLVPDGSTDLWRKGDFSFTNNELQVNWGSSGSYASSETQREIWNTYMENETSYSFAYIEEAIRRALRLPLS